MCITVGPSEWPVQSHQSFRLFTWPLSRNSLSPSCCGWRLLPKARRVFLSPCQVESSYVIFLIRLKNENVKIWHTSPRNYVVFHLRYTEDVVSNTWCIYTYIYTENIYSHAYVQEIRTWWKNFKKYYRYLVKEMLVYDRVARFAFRTWDPGSKLIMLDLSGRWLYWRKGPSGRHRWNVSENSTTSVTKPCK